MSETRRMHNPEGKVIHLDLIYCTGCGRLRQRHQGSYCRTCWSDLNRHWKRAKFLAETTLKYRNGHL